MDAARPNVSTVEKKLWENKARSKRSALAERVSSILGDPAALDWTDFEQTREVNALRYHSGLLRLKWSQPLSDDGRNVLTSLMRCTLGTASGRVLIGLGDCAAVGFIRLSDADKVAERVFELLDADGDAIDLIESGSRAYVRIDVFLDERVPYMAPVSYYEFTAAGVWADRAYECAKSHGPNWAKRGRP